MAEDKAFLALCREYATARGDTGKTPKEVNALYEACMEKGKALGMTRYAIEEAIERCIEERLL